MEAIRGCALGGRSARNPAAPDSWRSSLGTSARAAVAARRAAGTSALQRLGYWANRLGTLAQMAKTRRIARGEGRRRQKHS